MKSVTLKQMGKVVQMVIDKETPEEQLQWALESGALSDLLDANPKGFDRETYRKFLGLKPMNPPLLISVGTVTVAATTTPFVARDRFVVNTKKNAPVEISYLGYNFKAWLLDKTEAPFAGSVLRYATLTRYSPNGSILKELGGEEEAETTLAELFALMHAQPNGESGPLLLNGYANTFYIRDATGDLRAVGASWDDVGWDVDAGAVTNPGGWADGRQVFSRNSRLRSVVCFSDPWTLCPFGPRSSSEEARAFSYRDIITNEGVHFAERLRFFRHAFGRASRQNHAGYACHECARSVSPKRNIRELVSAAGGLLRPKYDSIPRVIKGWWCGWPRIRDDWRSPDGERELERRRLERERQCRDEPERVE